MTDLDCLPFHALCKWNKQKLQLCSISAHRLFDYIGRKNNHGGKTIEMTGPFLRSNKNLAGGYHVCGILELDSKAFCWGRSLDLEEEISVAYSSEEMWICLQFHACGIKSYDHGVICWGFIVKLSTPAPSGIKVCEIAAGNNFTSVSPGLCKTIPCTPGWYEFNNENAPCKSPNSHVCLTCSNGCPAEMYQKTECTLKSDCQCDYNCSSCYSSKCFSNCSALYSDAAKGKKDDCFWSLQLLVIIVEIGFAVFLVIVVSATAILYVRYRLRNCQCSEKVKVQEKQRWPKDNGKIRHDLDERKIRRAQLFSYEELERANNGFKDESLVGKGSFSCVYKGAIVSSDKQKNLKEFHTGLDLLSRLNHAHLLNLLGYCEEGGERLLKKALKEQLDWVRRVTIAVQAAWGIDYLDGYACPPNAHIADFGLSLLGPADSSSPLAELPAGTLGYLDPEYYRLHYLTTKSDVYSFGALLLEILSGRKAIDMQYEEGNIVEWAVSLIKAGDISMILDPVLKPPSELEALKRIVNVACQCVRIEGKERPSMDKVTTALEHALAQLMGSPCNEQPILPAEVVLGSSRLHKQSSQRSSNRSASETDTVEAEDQRFKFRACSWITFPSVTSSHRRKSSVSEADAYIGNAEDSLRSLEEEIGPASPGERSFLQHNF
uniref:non-specific serine/threonine protein kinase n=2 Tax=Manihot esculenta TaxID=3983 RepID=A0A2C9VJL6_MANES